MEKSTVRSSLLRLPFSIIFKRRVSSSPSTSSNAGALSSPFDRPYSVVLTVRFLCYCWSQINLVADRRCSSSSMGTVTSDSGLQKRSDEEFLHSCTFLGISSEEGLESLTGTNHPQESNLRMSTPKGSL
ncbi:hypothetical protein Nepgr_030640 [Nepenthes gracilis]|uniref:Uncharacterized protein n=1 Tax=Nepenthes gracilis TaxID=150966 RepID=A0AAD3Y410_NEPGR|nr:hypothetical protein Nepgr_030640 [Nepenthes gracilis]